MNMYPRIVRNFFVSGRMDGVATPISTGPKSAGGGFALDIHMRDAGQVTTPLRIEGYERDGTLTLNVANQHGVVIFTHKTTR